MSTQLSTMAVAESSSTSCVSIVSSDVLAAELDCEESSFDEDLYSHNKHNNVVTTM